LRKWLWLLLFCSFFGVRAHAQTVNTFCPINGNCTWTGNNTFSGNTVFSGSTLFPTVDFGPGTTLKTFGDSFGFCFNVTQTSCWAQVFSTDKNYAYINNAVSSTGVADAGQFGNVVQVVNTAPYLNYAYCCAINDMRNNLNSGQQGLWQQSYEALLWWLATPESSKTRSSAACSPSWGPINYTNNLYSTTTNGATCSFSTYGSDIVIIGAYQLANSSTTNATIDGIYTTPTITTDTNAFATVQFNQNFGPTFIHLTGLVEQTHTVTFTCVSASAGNPCYFIAGGSSFGVGAAGPLVYALETTKLETSPDDGYSVTSANCGGPCGSDALVAKFDMLEAQAVNDLHNMGLNVLLAPLNNTYIPNTTNTQSDGVHPNNTGSTLIGQALIAAAKGYLTPMDRGASATFTSLNPCTANATGGGLFAIGGLGVGAANACPPGMLRGDGAFSEFDTIGEIFLGHDGSGILNRTGNNWSISGNNVGLFQFYGTTSSYPALKANLSPVELISRAADDSGDIPFRALGFVSTTTTGSAPLTVTSTTPVSNLTVSNHPIVYNCGSTSTCSASQTTATKISFGTVALGSASPSTVTITALPYTSSSSYVCTATPTGATAAIAAGGVAISYVSGSSITLTGPNTVTTVINYSCIGT
jgi:hypothetical protein